MNRTWHTTKNGVSRLIDSRWFIKPVKKTYEVHSDDAGMESSFTSLPDARDWAENLAYQDARRANPDEVVQKGLF